jgi:hypothetical protein
MVIWKRGKGYKETFVDNKYNQHLDCGDGFMMNMYIKLMKLLTEISIA